MCAFDEFHCGWLRVSTNGRLSCTALMNTLIFSFSRETRNRYIMYWYDENLILNHYINVRHSFKNRSTYTRTVIISVIYRTWLENWVSVWKCRLLRASPVQNTTSGINKTRVDEFCFANASEVLIWLIILV